eukprot:1133644-Pelagomonas_calceolata.AAC.1
MDPAAGGVGGSRMSNKFRQCRQCHVSTRSHPLYLACAAPVLKMWHCKQRRAARSKTRIRPNQKATLHQLHIPLGANLAGEHLDISGDVRIQAVHWSSKVSCCA